MVKEAIMGQLDKLGIKPEDEPIDVLGEMAENNVGEGALIHDETG